MSRSVSRMWTAIASASVADDPRLEEARDLLLAHRGLLVAREPGDLAVRVPAPERGQVGRARGAAGRPSRRAATPGTSFDPPSLGHGIPSPPCAAGASWRSASRRPRRPPRRPPCSPTTSASSRRTSSRWRRSSSPAGRSPEADQRSIGLGWSAMATAIAEIAGVDRDALGAAYDRHSDLGLAVEDVLVGAGHAPPPEVSPTLPEVAAAFAAIEAASGPAREGRDPAADSSSGPTRPTAKGIVKVLGGDLRIGLREGLAGGGHRQGLRPAARRRQVGRDADRRRRPAREPRPRRPPRRGRDGAVPPAQVHARVAGRGRRRDHHAGSAPRSGSRTSTTASGRSSTSAGREVRLFSRDLHDVTTSSRRSPRRRRTSRGTASSTARSSAGRTASSCRSSRLQARLGRKTPSAAIQAEVPVIFVAFDVLALGPGDDRADRAAAPRAAHASGAGGSRRIDLPLAGDGGRFARSHLAVAARRRRAGGGVPRCPRAAQRGPDGQGPRERLLPGPARARLAEDEEGARDHRLRRGRRRGRPRQAPRRAERLHVRGPRHRRRTGWSRSARPTAG